MPLAMPGSPARQTTRPPLTPVYTEVISGSAATLAPALFIAVRARAPPIDAPKATS